MYRRGYGAPRGALMTRSPYYRRYHRRSTPLWKVPDAIPDVTRLSHHKYHHLMWCSPTDRNGITAGTAVQKFALNDLYDPNISGVGSSATLFDVMSGIWGVYTVESARIRVTMRPYSTQTTTYSATNMPAMSYPVRFTMMLNDDPNTNPITPGASLVYQQNSSPLMAQTLRQMGPVYEWAFNTGHFHLWYNPRSFWLQSLDAILPAVSGKVGAWDPASRCVCWFSAFTDSNLNDSGQWRVDFELDFWARWSRPISRYVPDLGPDDSPPSPDDT